MTAIRWIFPYRHTSLGMFDISKKSFLLIQISKNCLTFNLNFFFLDRFFYLSVNLHFEKVESNARKNQTILQFSSAITDD
jgi:hypothetical protein